MQRDQRRNIYVAAATPDAVVVQEISQSPNRQHLLANGDGLGEAPLTRL